MMSNKQEIRNLPDGFKKELPFSVPEAYFENFPVRLMEKIEKEGKTGTIERSRFTLKPVLAIAATLAALIVGGYIIIKLSLDQGTKAGPVQEFADVIDYYIYDFDDETIMTVFNEETDLTYLNNIYKEEEIINYLSEEEDLDYSELQDLY